MRGLTAEEAYLLEVSRPGALSSILILPDDQWHTVNTILYPRLIYFEKGYGGLRFARITTQGLLALRIYYEVEAMKAFKKTG